jgi:hypothetical protein
MKSIILSSTEVVEVLKTGIIARKVLPQPIKNKRGFAHCDGDYTWPHPDTTQVVTVSNSIARPGGPKDWIQDHSPFGQIGDMLWVKEKFVQRPSTGRYYYQADHLEPFTEPYAHQGWQRAKKMPREASRMHLLVDKLELHLSGEWYWIVTVQIFKKATHEAPEPHHHRQVSTS